MTLGKCYEVIRTDGTVLRFRILGGSEVIVEFSDGNKELLDVVLAIPYDEINEIPCEK